MGPTKGSSLQSFPEHVRPSLTLARCRQSSEWHLQGSRLFRDWMWQGCAQEDPPVCVEVRSCLPTSPQSDSFPETFSKCLLAFETYNKVSSVYFEFPRRCRVLQP